MSEIMPRSHVAELGEALALNLSTALEKGGCGTGRDQGRFLEARLLLLYPCQWLPPRFRTLACPSGWNSPSRCSTRRGQHLWGTVSYSPP